MTTKWNDLVFFTKPLQATVMLSLNFAESESLFYATMPLCLEVLISIYYLKPVPTFIFLFILLFVGGSLDYQMERLSFFFTKPLYKPLLC